MAQVHIAVMEIVQMDHSFPGINVGGSLENQLCRNGSIYNGASNIEVFVV